MGILSAIKSLLDLGAPSDAKDTQRGTEVAVERETATDTASQTHPDEAAPSQPVDDAVESVDVIKGIGPAYSERLAEHEITTVTDLANADPEALATKTGIGENRLANWIEQAKAR